MVRATQPMRRWKRSRVQRVMKLWARKREAVVVGVEDVVAVEDVEVEIELAVVVVVVVSRTAAPREYLLLPLRPTRETQCLVGELGHGKRSRRRQRELVEAGTCLFGG